MNYIWRNFVFRLNCNLSCTYCEHGAPYGNSLDIDDTIESVRYAIENIYPIISHQKFVRFEGSGELTTYSKVMKFILEEVPERYDFGYKEILSNGANFSKYRERLLEKNYGVVLSCDGHLAKINEANRKMTESQHVRLLEDIKWLSDNMGHRAEINCVLTQHNINHIIDYAAYLKDLGFTGLLNVFPVAAPDNLMISLHGMPDHTADIIDKLWDAHSDILPPDFYHARFRQLMLTGKVDGPACQAYNNYKSAYTGRDPASGILYKAVWCDCGGAQIDIAQLYTRHKNMREFYENFDHSTETNGCNHCVSHPNYNDWRLKRKGVVF